MNDPSGGLLPWALRILGSQLAREAEDRVRAEGLYLQLLRERPRHQLARVAVDPDFASPALAERLLKTAEVTATEAPRRAEHLAELALAIAARLTPPWGAFLAAGLAGSAWAWIGEARRERGDLGGAEEAQVEARLLLDQLAPDAPERGVLCRLLARLRRDQDRCDEALALAARALALAEALGDEEEAGACALDLAWLELAELESGAALPLFERAAATYREPDPVRPWLSARHGLALAAADLQDSARTEGALRELAEAAPALAPLDRLRVARVEAVVDQARDQNGRAAQTLERVWRELEEGGASFEALDAGLDLARLYLEQGRREDLERLCAALPASVPLPAPLSATLTETLEESLRSGRPPLEGLERLERLQATLLRARHDRSFPLPS